MPPSQQKRDRDNTIIFATHDDPVRSGLVGSLNRPEGNVTGVFGVSATVEGKQLGLLREVVPQAAVIGMLVNPASRSFRAARTRDAGCGARPWATASCFQG